MFKKIFILLNLFFLSLLAKGTPSKQRQENASSYLSASNKLCSSLEENNSPFLNYRATIFGEDHYFPKIRKNLEDKLEIYAKQENAVLILEHIPQKEFGAVLTRMTPDLQEYLKKLDQNFESPEGKGSFLSLVTTSFFHKIPVVPLEHSIRIYKHNTLKNGSPRMQVLTRRAYEVAQRFLNNHQIWLIGSAHVKALKQYDYIPGIADLFEKPRIYVNTPDNIK